MNRSDDGDRNGKNWDNVVLWYRRTKRNKHEATFQTKERLPILIGERLGIFSEQTPDRGRLIGNSG